jgi:hypothetical protein
MKTAPVAASFLLGAALTGAAQVPASAPAPTPAAAKPDPCKENLQTRDEILAAVPSADPAGKQALDGRGIAKVGDGWRQHVYYSGGDMEAPAKDAAFTAALGDYCAARAQAAAQANTKAGGLSAKQAARNAFLQQLALSHAQARAAETGGALPYAPETPPAAPAVNCGALCEANASCREADMHDFRCAKAAKDVTFYSCACP